MPRKKKYSGISARRPKHYEKMRRLKNKSADLKVYAAAEKRGQYVFTSTDTEIEDAHTSLDEAHTSLDEAHTSLDESYMNISYEDTIHHDHSYVESLSDHDHSRTITQNDSYEDINKVTDSEIEDAHISMDHSCVNICYEENINRDNSYVEIMSDHDDHDDHDGYSCSESVEDPPDMNVENSPMSLFDTIAEDLKRTLSTPYVCISNEEDIDILEVYKVDGRISVKLSVSINRTFQAKILVHRKELSASHDFWSGLPKRFDSSSKILSLLSKLQKYAVCIGNPDEEFQILVPIGSGLSGSSSCEVYAYREGDFSAKLGDLSYNSTIRSVDCGLLVEGRRCSSCATYRRSLRDRKHRMEDKSKHLQKNLINSTYKHKDMTKDMLIEKIRQQKVNLNTLQHEVDRSQRIIKRQIIQSGTVVPEHQNKEMADLLESCREDVQKAYPDENSLQRLFWDQQMKFYKCGKNGMRWHPMIIRWCLYLKQKSSKAYNAMRECGFINLPSARTLFDYSHYVESLGFQGDVVEMLKTEVEKKGLHLEENYKCYVGLLFDEIRVKEDLVYDKHSGEIVGYCNLDSIGNQVLEMEKIISTANHSEPAKSMLVIMVRGISTDLKFPLAGFATNSITADFLYLIMWKAIFIMEEIVRLKVLFLTCDGASANRKFFNLHKVEDDQLLVHYTINPHDRARKIFFISDVPHLLKTTRNCFSNSYSHTQTRKLWKNGKDISWLHIVKLYEEHCELAVYNPCPKLKRDHIDMTAFSCMKVNLAAQVLSNSVANALEELYQEEVSETVEFVRNFNKFFDCLNVRSLYEGRNKRNPDLNPFKEVDDARLDWLKSNFLGYLENWSASVDSRAGDFTKSQRNGMKLSQQTITGLKISVCSIVECVKFMLNEGAKFVLTHHFNQDPLEQHFGHYRHNGGHNNNPTVYDVRNTMTELRTVGVQALTPRNGNIRRENRENINPINNSKLPKRKK